MKYILFTFVFASSLLGNAQIPANYYNNAAGKSGAQLKTALWNIIKNPAAPSYSSLYTHYQKTDKKPNGKVWCMYSDVPGGTPPYEYSFSQNCGTYTKEGDCFNREHSFPQSWFNSRMPMQSDLFHVYPTDGWVNSLRSNWPYGYVTTITHTTMNGSKLGKDNGARNYGYTGTVFEVIDAYKGDFARTQLYMAICYEDKLSSWVSNSNAGSVLNGTAFPGFHSWYLNTLLEWHIKDPVSQKEIDRNNEVFKIQGNRNPLIDSPQFVQRIWFASQPPIVQFTAGSGIISEGNTGIKTYTATISVPAKLSYPTTITLSAAPSSTATLGVDYVFSPSTFTFQPSMNAQTQNITITIMGDTITEPDETAIIQIQSTTLGAPIGTIHSHALTILNDDGSSTTPLPPVIEFETMASSVTEGNIGAKIFKIPVKVHPAPSSSVSATVSVESVGTTATSSHFNLLTNSVSFSSTKLTDSIEVAIIGDTINNSNRTAVFRLSNPAGGATIGNQLFTLTIQDDDTTITSPGQNTSIQFETDETVLWEGNETRIIYLPVSAYPAPTTPVTAQVAIDFRFTSATTNDFELLTHQVSFSPTQSTDQVAVKLLGNLIRENDRFVAFKLSNVVGNAQIGEYGTIRITIQDDDSAPLSHSNVEKVFLVYPNPTSDKLYLDGDIQEVKKITLYNLLGNTVFELTQINDATLDVYSLPSGAYLLEILTYSQLHRFKILKK
ncbi:MAG: endonuclease [Cytophagales bacterium]|nr:endonuclease [Cytophagales bacterium]MDW8383999.1 endonuclease [Flammeovirgaceae bacterium]